MLARNFLFGYSCNETYTLLKISLLGGKLELLSQGIQGNDSFISKVQR